MNYEGNHVLNSIIDIHFKIKENWVIVGGGGGGVRVLSFGPFGMC